MTTNIKFLSGYFSLQEMEISDGFCYISPCQLLNSIKGSLVFHGGIPIPFQQSTNCFLLGENNWKKLNSPPFLQQNQSCNFVHVAASGGLIYFQSAANEFIISNPVTGISHQLVSLNFDLQESKILRAIAMISSSKSYKLVLVYGESSQLLFRVYHSKTNQWEEEIKLNGKIDGPPAESGASKDENAVYFLSKCGNVVSTDLQNST